VVRAELALDHVLLLVEQRQRGARARAVQGGAPRRVPPPPPPPPPVDTAVADLPQREHRHAHASAASVAPAASVVSAAQSAACVRWNATRSHGRSTPPPPVTYACRCWPALADLAPPAPPLRASAAPARERRHAPPTTIDNLSWIA